MLSPSSNLELLVEQLKQYYEEDEHRAIMSARQKLQEFLGRISGCDVTVTHLRDGGYCLRIHCLRSSYDLVKSMIPTEVAGFPVHVTPVMTEWALV